MKKAIAGLMGMVVGGLAAGHVVSRDDRLFGMLDTEWSLTAARIPIAGSLLYAAIIAENDDAATTTLRSVGASYLGMGAWAMLDRNLGGTMKRGFSNADIAFHLATGAAALIASMLPTSKK